LYFTFHLQIIKGNLLRCYTEKECDEWLSGRLRVKPDLAEQACVEQVNYPKTAYQFYFFATWIATELTFQQPTLLWVTEWGIWPSSENWHLYYKLRQSYGDTRLLEEAPGHLFLNYETADLASILQVCMMSGLEDTF